MKMLFVDDSIDSAGGFVAVAAEMGHTDGRRLSVQLRVGFRPLNH